MKDYYKLRESERRDNTEKTFVRTLLFGVIINFIILSVDNPYKSEEGPYLFFLVISLFVGWVISFFFFKKEKNNL